MAINETAEYYGLEIIWDALKLAIKELIDCLPSIFMALTLIAIYCNSIYYKQYLKKSL